MAHLNKDMVSLHLEKDEKYQLDLYAEVLGTSRRKLLEAIIASSVKDLITMDKLDLLVSGVRALDQLEMFKGSLRLEKVLKMASNIEKN